MRFWYKSAENYQCHPKCSCEAERQGPWSSCFSLREFTFQSRLMNLEQVYDMTAIFFRKVMAGIEATCHTCHVIHRKSVPGEVWYDKDGQWLCLNCHLAERKLRKLKGKGRVLNVFQRCSRCEGDCPESRPCIFCYDCSLFLCEKHEKCEQNRTENDDCVCSFVI